MIQGLRFDPLKVLLDRLFTLAYHNTELIMTLKELMILLRCIKCYDTRPKGDPLKLIWGRLTQFRLPLYTINYSPIYKIS